MPELRRCLVCEEHFLVSNGERAFYETRTGADWDPELCRACRTRHRDDIEPLSLIVPDDDDA